MNVQGSLHPIAEIQAKWWTQLLNGKCALPDGEEMEKNVKEWVEAVKCYKKKISSNGHQSFRIHRTN